MKDEKAVLVIGAGVAGLAAIGWKSSRRNA